MPAYVIVDVEIHDVSAYGRYKELTPASIAAYGGRFLVRGGNTQTIEGNWQPGRIVLLEFPDMEHAHRWWNSVEYAEAKKIRQSSASTAMIFVEGVMRGSGA